MKQQVIILLILSLLALSCVCQDNDSIKSNTIKFNSPVENIVWCGSDRVQDEDDDTIVLEGEKETKHPNTIFVQTLNGQLYLTRDHGQQWSNITDTIQSQFKQQLEGDTFKVQDIKISPANAKTVFMFGTNGKSFVSQNCGKKIFMINHEKSFHDFKLNKNNSKYLLAHKYQTCKKFDDECEVGEKQLYLSKDMGRTFKSVSMNINYGTWDKNSHEEGFEDNRIIYHKRQFVRGKNNDKQLLYYTDDFFENKSQISDDVVHYFQTPHYLFILTNSEIKDSYNLKVSAKDQNPYSQFKVQDIQLPIKRNKDHSFTVLETQEGKVFLGINHQGHESKMTNIYYSDISGVNYTLGLLNAVRDEEGNVDFDIVKSSPETFISNVYDKDQISQVETQKKQADSRQQTRYDSPQYKAKVFDNSKYNTLDSIKKSVISYNGGSTWHPIKAPKKSYKGEDLNCSGECSLHLVGRTENIGEKLVTSKQAFGLLIATGNTGQYLTEKEEDLNTYLSNDGGHSWKEIRQHPHIYEIGDRGGIIIIARANQETTKIHYSYDLGETWTRYEFTQKPITVQNIVIEQGNMGQKFLIMGKRNSTKNRELQGVTVSVDFSSLHQRVCQGKEDPDSDSSDFETYTPKNYDSDSCVLGQKVEYVRRKQKAQCLQEDNDRDDHIIVTQCQCTEEDFECAFGFYRNDDQECVPMNKKYEINEEQTQAPANCKGTYEIPTGYQKISISKCTGGVDKGPIKKQCPAKEANQSTSSRFIDDDEDNKSKSKNNKKPTTTKQQNNQQQYGNQQDSESSPLLIWGIVLLVAWGAYQKKEVLLEKADDLMLYVKTLMTSQQQQRQQQGYGQLDEEGGNHQRGGERLGLMDDDEDD